jgi:hypothetical protein
MCEKALVDWHRGVCKDVSATTRQHGTIVVVQSNSFIVPLEEGPTA